MQQPMPEIIPDKQPTHEHVANIARKICGAATIGIVYVFKLSGNRFAFINAGPNGDRHKAQLWIKMPDREFVGAYDSNVVWSEIYNDLMALCDEKND